MPPQKDDVGEVSVWANLATVLITASSISAAKA